MLIHSNLKQSQRNNSRWWSERRPRLTASTFGDILNRKSVSNAFLRGLVGDKNIPGNSRNLPESLKHGIEYESKALEQYENYLKHSGYPVKTFPSGFVVNPAFPFLGCSPDAKIIDETEDNPFGILEIKYVPTNIEMSHQRQHVLVMVNFIWK